MHWLKFKIPLIEMRDAPDYIDDVWFPCIICHREYGLKIDSQYWSTGPHNGAWCLVHTSTTLDHYLKWFEYLALLSWDPLYFNAYWDREEERERERIHRITTSFLKFIGIDHE